MFFSGIADEAGADLSTQIKAHRELGWNHIELRLVNGRNVCTLSDAEFKPVFQALKDAGMIVSCLASPIGDWSHSIRDIFLPDANLMRRAVRRAHQLAEFGLMVPVIRVMSYPNDKNKPTPEICWRRRAIERMLGLIKIAERSGVRLAHENCSGWGGISSANNVALLTAIDDPLFGVLFDTGNPPTYGHDSWQWYLEVRKRIVYVHIKDAKLNLTHDPKNDVYTYPGEGDGCVRKIVTDLLNRGYEGGFSIEPHLAQVIHTGQQAADAQKAFDFYVEYGRRLMQIVEDATRNTA